MCFILLVFSAYAEVANPVPRLNDEYDPAKWPKATLKLSQAATLKNVFDSGLRPYRFPGLENTTLEVKHLNLMVSLGSGNKLPLIQAEVMRIKPFRDGEIATIEGFTPKLTLDQARAEMLKWLPYAENDRTKNDIEIYLDAVRADYLDFDDPYRGISHGCSVYWKEPGWKTKGGGPQVVAWFRKTTSVTHPLRIHFKATWSSNRPQKNRGTYRPDPIEPPPGYEDVDMTAPENIGPDSMVGLLRSKGVDVGDGNGGIPQEEYFRSLKGQQEAEPEEPETVVQTDEEERGNLRIFWLLGAVLALAFLIWQIMQKHDRRGSAG